MKKDVEVMGLYDAGVEIGYAKAIREIVEYLRRIAVDECDNTDECPCGHWEDLSHRLESGSWKKSGKKSQKS